MVVVGVLGKRKLIMFHEISKTYGQETDKPIIWLPATGMIGL